MPIPTRLRFGIESLDKLIGTVKREQVAGEDEDEVGIHGIDLTELQKAQGSDPKANDTSEITSSLCLAGPDGTGKSVLSLHMASRYLADCLLESSNTPASLKILYISTDLTFKMALKGWKHFALDRPLLRREPLVDLKTGRKEQAAPLIEIDLKQYFPSSEGESDNSIVNCLEKPSHVRDGDTTRAEVCFVDLASRTAGDDWGFVHRLLSTLEEPTANEARHLVVLDAVEGFETLVGDLNAFGEKSSRRSRIAQVMRLAAGKCHLVLVVEEGHKQRFPEEFVTDVVVRLRNIETARYVRRTVEIEKARGQWHRRGQHPYVIRDGRGSTTGSQQNADDPKVFQDEAEKVFQSYVHVFPSLNYTSREIMIDRYNPLEVPDEARFAAFGLPYLDNMLGGRGEKAERAKGDYDTRGLTCGSTTALIGDSMTQKSQLGKAFLSRAFYPFADELRTRINEESEGEIAKQLKKQVEDGIRAVAMREKTASDLLKETLTAVRNQVHTFAQQDYTQAGKVHPVAVLFTTQDMNLEGLVDDFYQWLREEEVVSEREPEAKEGRSKKDEDNAKRMEEHINWFAKRYKEQLRKGKHATSDRKGAFYRLNEFKEHLIEKAFETYEAVVKEHITNHTICRRFEIHDLPGAVLMNIFQRSIEKAQRKMFAKETSNDALPPRRERFRNSWRVRVVIDDLNSLRNTYPEMREDSLLLPSLVFMLGREGVTSLLVDTQTSGSPELSITERFDSSIRELVHTRLYIWRLPFYGEHRVAISVIPPISHEYRGLIRELRWETKNENRTDRALTVDPHFELYLGLEKAQPQPVPLEVRLYADTPCVEKYIATEEKLLREIFTPVRKEKDEPCVINAATLDEYEALRDACHVQRDTRLDHTTILQVNEFWWLRRTRQRRAGAFRPQWNYLSSTTATSRGDKYYSDPVVDPFWVFQPSASENRSSKINDAKRNSNEKRKVDFFDDKCGYDLLNVKEHDGVDRIPYTWDFGFLLCNGKAWEEVLELGKERQSLGGTEKKVEEVWKKLCKATEDSTSCETVSWRAFLEASKIVADFQSFRTSSTATAFDFTMLVPESFSCLMLEMWLSEAYDTLGKYEDKSRNDASKNSLLHRRRELLREVGQRHWHSELKNPVTLLSGLQKENGKSLTSILNERKATGEVDCFSLELYKVWLLLTEAINFEELVDSSSHLNFEFKSRDVSPHAVSARHWYKTASKFIDSLTREQVEYNWVPVRLPGHFSVRADWFLAVAGGSRSSRLADHALDLLSSQRANVTRLQEGIGFPTRRLFDKENKKSHLRTRLISAEKGKPLANVEYDLLRRIGAQKNTNEEFYWLWRSRIWAYNRHSRIWHKWLNRALLWWHSWRQRYGSDWSNGFHVYDQLAKLEFSDDAEEIKQTWEEISKLKSWDKFHELRDILIAELAQVSISTD